MIRLAGGVAILLALTTAVYSNHFYNAFHFDDFHTVTENVHIRKLGNVGRFFTDPATFSVLPTHQVYRPVVTTSLALDYWLAQGLHPFAFHASTFFWYATQLVLLYLLYLELLGGSRSMALFGAALYGVHPVAAETVNYVIQRAEVYSTLGLIAALLLYIRKPEWRRYGIYLLPFVLACLSKPPALVFPALLFLYVWLYEAGGARRAVRATLPALGVAAALGALLHQMTAASFTPGAAAAAAYRITQTWVTLRYFATFFWPSHLSADGDTALIEGLSMEAAAGTAFLLGLVAIIFWTAQREETRTIAFGLGWFLIALLPTALMPLAEAANDHRMFFPFVGLVASVCAALKVGMAGRGVLAWRFAAAAACVILAAASAATYQRNEVWRSEETLWLDVTRKSPKNNRGWMNYGLTQMTKGENAAGLASLERALALDPTYALAQVNSAIALARLGRGAEAEAYFQRGLALDPSQAASHLFYGRWLLENRRYADAVTHLERTLAINPVDLMAHHLLMQAQFVQQNWSALRPLAESALRLDSNDALAKDYLAKFDDLERGLARQQRQAEQARTPEAYLDLSLAYFRAGRFSDCIDAARQALELRPLYADAFNNVAACYNALGRWDDGIAAATEAARLNPSSELARNNLAWAVSQKELSQP
jgi:tetratricopeptide (TPR) repeat protein